MKVSCRRWIKRGLIACVLTGLCVVATTYWAFRQTSQVPEFYSRAKKQLPVHVAAASKRLRNDVQQLQDDAAKLGSWHASFSDTEINAWLVEELPKKFPMLLANGASDPRILIEDGRVLAAVQYKNRHIDTVISCEILVSLTEQPNMLAVRLNHLRAGALPLPLNSFLQGITREAAKGGFDIHWDMTAEGPVALVAVPSEHPGYAVTPVIVESVQLVEGELRLAGHTGALAAESYRPRGSVHQFVSYRTVDNRKIQSAGLSHAKNSPSIR
jgi:hypothetical protein